MTLKGVFKSQLIYEVYCTYSSILLFIRIRSSSSSFDGHPVLFRTKYVYLCICQKLARVHTVSFLKVLILLSYSWQLSNGPSNMHPDSTRARAHFV